MYDKAINDRLKECAIARKNNNLTKAQEIINDLLAKYPNCDSVLFEKAILDKVNNNFNEAQELFTELLNTPKRPLALMELGNMEFTQKNYDKALLNYYRLYNEAKFNIKNFYNFKNISFSKQKIGIIYRLQKKYNKALNTFNELLNYTESSPYKNSKDISIILSEIGNTYLELGALNKAIEYFDLSSQQSPDIYHKYFEILHIALIYLNSHQTTDTINICDFVIDMFKNKKEKNHFEVNALYFKARALFLDCNFKDSYNLFNDLLNTDYHRVALENLINLSFKMENYSICLKHLQNYFAYLNSLPYTKNLQYKNDHFNRLYNIVKFKLGYNELDESFDLHVYQHYDIQKTINKLEQNKSLNIFDAKDFLKYLPLNKEDFYGTDIYDIYYVNILNIGEIEGKNTDFIKVQTLINTNKIVKINPTKSLNHERKKEIIDSYELKKIAK